MKFRNSEDQTDQKRSQLTVIEDKTYSSLNIYLAGINGSTSMILVEGISYYDVGSSN